MKVTIQAVPDRLSAAIKIAEATGGTIHLDRHRVGSFQSFKDMLDIEVADYRLHLQDDVILSPRLLEYLPVLESVMRHRGIHVLSLFAPRRKHIHEQLENGTLIAPFPNFLWLQAVIFSKDTIELMRLHSRITTEKKHDDVFVRETLRKYRITAFVHVPSLVQHDLGVASIMGHPNSERRTSECYDPTFIERALK